MTCEQAKYVENVPISFSPMATIYSTVSGAALSRLTGENKITDSIFFEGWAQ